MYSDSSSCWAVLGLEPTTEARKVRRAYAMKLKTCRPEQDPQGFQRLHEAYQQALELTAKAEQPTVLRAAPTKYDEQEQPDPPGDNVIELRPGVIDNPQATEHRELPAEVFATRWWYRASTLLGDPDLREQLPPWLELTAEPRLAELAVREHLAFQSFAAVAAWLRQELPQADPAVRGQIVDALNDVFHWNEAELELTRLHGADAVDRVMLYTRWYNPASAPLEPERPRSWAAAIGRLLFVAVILGAVIRSLYLPFGDEIGTALRSGDFETAADRARARINAEPGNPAAHDGLAAAYFGLGSLDSALQAIRTSQEMAPAPHRFELGARIQQAMGDWYGATADWESALELEPDNHGLQNAVAWILATAPNSQARNGDRAVALALRANDATGKRNPAYMDTLAAAYAEVGDFAAAADWQSRAIARLRTEDVQAGGYDDRLQAYRDLRPWRQSDPVESVSP